MKQFKWKNKETGKIFNVTPWWTCESELIDKPAQILKDELDDWPDRLFSVGVLAQIGWLIENDNGVWFGVGPTAKDNFEDISDPS